MEMLQHIAVERQTLFVNLTYPTQVSEVHGITGSYGWTHMPSVGMSRAQRRVSTLPAFHFPRPGKQLVQPSPKPVQ